MGNAGREANGTIVVKRQVMRKNADGE